MNVKPQLLIKSAHLENFVLHKDTFVEFDRPIVLLTGGNSSGKTLFLEGFLLALGIKSQRIRDGKISAIIGSNGTVTRGTVQLNNPMNYNRRTICFDSEQIDEMLDSDVFSIGFEVSSKDTNLNYFIINNDNKHTITLSLLTHILDRINLDIRNKLVFTESGDVSELVSSSPRKRFEILLKITGMQDRFVQVTELSQKSLDLTPMLQRLEEENKRRAIELNNLKTILDEIKKKELLEERKTFLQGALLWCEYLEIKAKIDKIILRNSDLKYREKELIYNVSQESSKLENVNAELTNLETMKLAEERSRYKIVREENDLKHKIDALQNEIGKINDEISTLNEDLKNLKHVDNEEIQSVVSFQKDFNKKFEIADKEFITLQREYNNSLETANLFNRLNLDSEIDEQIFTALKLSAFMKNIKIKFWGPLCLEIKVNDKTIMPLLEDILFEFVIFNDYGDDSFTSIIENIVNNKIPLLCITFLPSDYQISSNNSSKNIVLHDFIDCDNNEISRYLSNKYDVVIQKDNNYASIQDFMIKHRNSNKLLYFPEKLMSISARGRIKFHSANSIDIYNKFHMHKSRTFDEIEKALNARENIKIIQPKLDILADNVKKYQNDYIQISAQLHEFNENRKTYEILSKAIKNSESDVFQKQKMLEKILIERQDLQDKLDKLSSISNISVEIEELGVKRDELNKNIGKYQNELITVRNEFNRNIDAIKREEVIQKEKAAAAKTYTPKIPNNLNYQNEPEIRQQITEIEIKIKNLEHLPTTFEQYERKKAEYESHARKLKRTKKVFYELAERLDHERNLWQTQLQEYIDLINNNMRTSLSERFSHIRIYLSEPENINKCGLHIEARHKQAYIDGTTMIRGLSGGERGIVTQAFIFATHLLMYSPLHVIDEFTQRMDISTKELAFNIATSTAIRAKKMRESMRNDENYTEYAYDPLFILACPDTAGLDFSTNDLFEHLVCLRLADGNSNVINK